MVSNGQNIVFSDKKFQKGHIWLIYPLKKVNWQPCHAMQLHSKHFVCTNVCYFKLTSKYFDFDNTPNFELAYFDFETLTSIFEVKKLYFETSTSKYFDTRNAEAYCNDCQIKDLYIFLLKCNN